MLNKDELAIKEIKLVLPSLHPAQKEIFFPINRQPTRFTSVAAGVKFGKTLGAAIYVVHHLWQNNGHVVWWVAPTLRQCKLGWDEIIRLIPKNRLHPHKTDMILEVRDLEGNQHSRVEFKSAETPGFLRGAKVNLALIDECAMVSEDSFTSVFTTLTQTQGEGFFISTPKGRSNFFNIYMRGVQGSPTFDPEYFSTAAPSWANPYIPPKSIEAARNLMPPDVFRQEYGGEFVGDSAGVFTDVNSCINGATFTEPERGHSYILGLDLAKHTDFTVITVMDRNTRKVVYWDRFNKLPWPEQKYRIVLVARKYNRAKVIIDATRGSYGDSVLDDLKDTGQFPIEGYEISTAKAKAELIKGLILAISETTITFPKIDQLIYELKTFEFKITPSGTLTYSAPKYCFDDCVISLALAVWGLKQSNFIYYHKSIRGI